VFVIAAGFSVGRITWHCGFLQCHSDSCELVVKTCKSVAEGVGLIANLQLSTNEGFG